VAGNGVEATFDGCNIRAGNPYWLGIEDHPIVRKVLAIGLTMFCVTLNGRIVAVFGLQDVLRRDALKIITELKKRSIAISIISGDNEEAVHSIAIKLDIPFVNVRARCSPEQKQAYVKTLLANTDHECSDEHHSHNHKHRHKHVARKTILFIGDGTNDAPSLAQASIGLHISEGGTDVAQSAADAVLMHPALHGIITLIDLSKAFHRRVVFNFAWSFAYNLAAVLLAAGVFGNVRIPPAYAGLGEVVSVVPVVGVALSLRWWKG
jgi:Cu2+-exporting ATPase